MQINCLDPRIIRNPRLNYHPHEYVAIYANGVQVNLPDYLILDLRFFRHFTWSPKYLQKKGELTPDNIESYFAVLDSGAVEPLYMLVPCGHCDICKERKINEWKLRAACETTCWENHPYFITLTYNKKHLPKDGVQKDAVQKFMKRFRTNLARTLNVEYKDIYIRYIYCGEYGHNNHRPHYHILVWNLPTCLHSSAIHALVKLSWSGLRGIKARKEWSKNFIWYTGAQEQYKGQLIFQHCTKDVPEQYGYVYTKKADSGCAGYICKYMRKDCVVPKGCNPTFFGCSRRSGGIGVHYLPTIQADYLKDAEMNEIEVLDQFTGMSVSGAIPQFFKNKLTPSLQLGLGYDTYHKFERLNALAYGLTSTSLDRDGSYFARFLAWCDNHPVYSEFVKMYRETPKEYGLVDQFGNVDHAYDVHEDHIRETLNKEYEDLLVFFDDLDIDYKKLKLQMAMRVLHAMACQEYAELHVLTRSELEEKAYQITEKARKAHDREIL